jgi:hypothetical protein
VTATLADLLRIDDQLVAAGHHALTPWWRAELERFYGTGATTFVGQVGRGGVKSHTSAKVGLAETLFGDWRIGLGERHYFAFISATKDEAAQRLLLLESFLGALGVPYDRQGDTIALRDLPRGFRVFAQQVASVSGFRCFGFAADELAKWRDSDGRMTRASETIASVNAMTITHPGARALLISSPWSTETYHYRRMQMGSAGGQVVAQAPSWVANPGGITEEEARRREPDDATFRREYAAEASDTILESFLGEEAIQRSIDRDRTEADAYDEQRRYFLAIDPAFAATGDLFGYCALTSELGAWDSETHSRDERRRTVVREIGAWKPTGDATALARIVQGWARRYETDRVASDENEAFSFKDLARIVGNVKVDVVRTPGGSAEDSKTNRYRRVRAEMLDGRFRIPNDAALIAELRCIASELSASGNELIRLPRVSGHHCDRVSAMVLAATIAFEKRPHLPPAKETYFEKQQRYIAEQAFRHIMSGSR